jgi:PTS system mannose-specific IID component
MRIDTTARPVIRLSRRVRLAVLLRSLVIQGSWNYRTLIGGGFGFALLPILRLLHGGDQARLDEAVERHTRLFNGHPYLVPLALGAVAALEARGESAARVERFKTAIRGSLGTLGDRLVWVGWRPVCLLGALVLLLSGAQWWVGVLGFLLIYNAGQIALRIWAFNLGLRDPDGIGARISRSAVAGIQRRWMTAGVFLIGLALPLLLVGFRVEGGGAAIERPLLVFWWIAGGVGAIVGVRLGGRVRGALVILLAAFTLVGLVFGLSQ